MNFRQSWLAIPLLVVTTACSSSSYEGVDMALELSISGEAGESLIIVEGEERTLDFMMVGLTDMKLIACAEKLSSTSLIQRFADLIVPSAHAHGVNTPISNGTTFELRWEKYASALHLDERAFYPGAGFEICGLQLTFAHLDQDAEFLSQDSPLLGARVHAEIEGTAVHATGRDSVVFPLDRVRIDAGKTYTLKIAIDGSLDGTEVLNLDSNSDAANALFDAFLTLIHAEILTN